MKIAAFADLHCGFGDFRAMDRAQEIAIQFGADVVVIAGDVTEHDVQDPVYHLTGFKKPVVYCMGNHEFAGKTVNQKITEIKELQERYDGYNIYCLDVLGVVTLEGVMFGGGCLWYDGTLGSLPPERKAELMKVIDPDWFDCRIKQFDALKEHKRCLELMEPLKHHHGTKVMVTHTCPHKKLNWFEYGMPLSKFNIYSGCADILSEFHPDIAICGHTHKQMIANIDGVRAFNIGNDYYWYGQKVLYSIIETNMPENKGTSESTDQSEETHNVSQTPYQGA